jgi:hypothetical protein
MKAGNGSFEKKVFWARETLSISHRQLEGGVEIVDVIAAVLYWPRAQWRKPSQRDNIWQWSGLRDCLYALGRNAIEQPIEPKLIPRDETLAVGVRVTGALGPMTGCASSASIGSQDLANSLDLKMISNTDPVL